MNCFVQTSYVCVVYKYWIYGSKLSLNGHNTAGYNTEMAVIGG